MSHTHGWVMSHAAHIWMSHESSLPGVKVAKQKKFSSVYQLANIQRFCTVKAPRFAWTTSQSGPWIPGFWVANTWINLKREIMVNLTLHFHISSGGRDDFAKLNRNASAANLIRIRPATYIYIHIFIYLCMYTHMYTHVYIYTYIYIYSSNQASYFSAVEWSCHKHMN